jgi:hypothetical protein
MSDAENAGSETPDWPRNYFNYFTEVEEHFQRARGSGLFLLSPLDWALIDTWRVAGVPLEAVLKGIDDAFEKWRSRKSKRRLVNSLAYCAQAVLEVAQRTPNRSGSTDGPVDSPFAAGEISRYLLSAASVLRERTEPAILELASSLESLAAEAEHQPGNLEELELRLTAMEDKLVAIVRSSQSDEDLFQIHQALNSELKPYRGKMTADQLAALERRYLEAALLERAKLPRLSLFYLH